MQWANLFIMLGQVSLLCVCILPVQQKTWVGWILQVRKNLLPPLNIDAFFPIG